MKNALVTGGAGFIGLNLVKELNKKGYNILVLLNKNGKNDISKIKQINSSIEIIRDVDELISNAHKYESFDSIFHLASVGVSPDFDDISLICDTNIKLSCKLVDFAKLNNSKLLVNFGSCFEYGDHGEVLLSENMPCNPQSLYAISKNSSTKMVAAYSKSKLVNSITVRPFGVFGEGESINRLAPSIIYNCLNGIEIKTTEGNQVRDFVNVKDVVKSIICLSESKYEPYGIYNICSNNPVRVKDFIKEIIDVCGFDEKLIKFGAIPYRKNEAMVFAGDNSKLQKVINYNFSDNHKDGIIDIYNTIRR